MKIKLFAIVAITMFYVSLSQAVTFAWSSNQQVAFGGSVISTTESNAFAAYLIHLGTGTWDSYLDPITSTAGLTSGQVAGPVGPQTTGSVPNRGKVNGGAFNTAVAGNNYGMLIVYQVNPTTTWYNFSNIYTVDAGATEQTQGLEFSSVQTWAPNTVVYYGAGTLYSTIDDAISSITGPTGATAPTGWYRFEQIPEPTTAGLALAGLALLFRRKRK